MKLAPGWVQSDAPAAGGNPFIDIKVRDFQYYGDTGGLGRFFDEYRRERLNLAHSYAYFDTLNAKGKGHYILWEYVWQPRESNCRYNVIEHVFRSNYPKREKGFVVSAGYCEEDASRREFERQEMLLRFREID